MLWNRYNKTGNTVDLEAAISYLELVISNLDRVVSPIHKYYADQAHLLTTLANMLSELDTICNDVTRD